MTSLQFAGKVIAYCMYPVVKERMHWRRWRKSERRCREVRKVEGMGREVINERNDGVEEHVRNTDRHKYREKTTEACRQTHK